VVNEPSAPTTAAPQGTAPKEEHAAPPDRQTLVQRAVLWIDLPLSHVLKSLRRIAPRARGRLLDVGCGDKPYASIFAPFVSSYLGVEKRESFEMTHTASSGHARPDILYDGWTLPFDDASFETLLCVQVLEHTPDPQRLVSEMARVMTSDGLMILTAPFSFRVHEAPHDYFRYSPYGLRELCKKAGLEVFELEVQGMLWSLLAHKLNTFLTMRVARFGAVAQKIGVLGHEPDVVERPRYWTLPIVAPAIAAIATSGRLLDKLVPDDSETLGYVVLARKAQNGKHGR